MQQDAENSVGAGGLSAGHGEYARIQLELEREKISLERERLAHEREKLALERMKLDAECGMLERRRRYVLSPAVGMAVAIVFLIAGIGVGALVIRSRAVRVGALDGAPVILRSTQDGSEREGMAYLLFVK